MPPSGAYPAPACACMHATKKNKTKKKKTQEVESQKHVQQQTTRWQVRRVCASGTQVGGVHAHHYARMHARMRARGMHTHARIRMHVGSFARSFLRTA